jgi:hypothetical protein
MMVERKSSGLLALGNLSVGLRWEHSPREKSSPLEANFTPRGKLMMLKAGLFG